MRETRRQPRESVAILPSNRLPSRGATETGTSALLTASFQYAIFSWSGTASVVSTTLNWFPLGIGGTGAVQVVPPGPANQPAPGDHQEERRQK